MRTILLSGTIGGAIGLTYHVIWHGQKGISLFSFAPHIYLGALYTFVGAAMGLLIGFLIKKYAHKFA